MKDIMDKYHITNKYPVPARLRHQAAIKEVWPGIPAVLPGAVALPYFAYYNSWTHPGVLALIAWLLLTLLILAYAYWWAMRNRAVVYEVNGVTCIWAAHEYYVPPEIYAAFMELRVWSKFANVSDEPMALLDGVVILFEGAKPYARVREANGTISLKRVFGATQPWKRYSRVDGSRRMDKSVDGYELKLHCAHALFFGRPEVEDLAWMRSEGIL